MRVYPPGRWAYLAESVSNNFATTARLWICLSTSLRAWRVSFFESVTSFSANGLSSFALASVVVIFSLSNSAVERLRSRAMRCSVVRPSYLPATRCLITASSGLRASWWSAAAG